MYEAVANKPDFPDVERQILAFWEKQAIFEKSLHLRKKHREFVFYDGPPFATGLPHYGHLLAGTIKDIVPRYQTMKGKYVDRRFGWDCHGLPIEYEVEQELGIRGKTDIEKLGVDVFNEKCRSIVLRHTEEWRKTVTRMGRWVDFDRGYKTMEPSYMESIWWVFKSLWDKNLVYEGEKILPYCPRCSTPLSNFETNQGYADVQDPAITVRFKIENEDNAYILAWTTTPWTLPSNMALAVGRDIMYARLEEKDAVYYLAADRVPAHYGNRSEYERLKEVPGAELVGLKYEPLFPYFRNCREKGAFRVTAGDFVSTEEGTGVVHVAPGFGEDDHQLSITANIPVVCPVDDEGRFTDEVTDYAGQKVRETDSAIIDRLKNEGKLVHRSTISHSYPHCWRCETPLIYRAVSTWFVRVERIKDQILRANKEIHWVPEHLRDGRFGKWLEGARDWAVSRNRYWGTPLPIWISEDRQETVCAGSIRELEELSRQKITDLHKHFVDRIEIPSKEGRGVLRRIPEVLDCWFESGAMPYAQAHYPFESREHFETHFPADFIAEGLDQTRGWFYTLMVLSVALFERPPFKNVVVNGLVLAQDGRKMSKRLKNYPDPAYMIDTYGADALRLYMINSPVVRAEDLRFSEEGVNHMLRHILIPLWNAYSFFVTYANIDGWQGEAATGKPSDNVLDRWIKSSMESLTREVTSGMDEYDLQRGVRPFVRFIENLTNWYIRRSRRRFWKSQDDDDKRQAYGTLNHVLIQLSKIAAPFVPFISESIYRNLRSNDMPESVHLCDYPVQADSNLDPDLERRMELAMTVVRLGRLLRSESGLKVRQPLSSLYVVSNNRDLLREVGVLKDIILDELNVKKLEFGDKETELVVLKPKADFKRLGPRFGKKVKEVAQAVAAMSEEVVRRLIAGESIRIAVADESVELAPEDVVIERLPREGLVVAAEGPVIVALGTDLTEDLIQEGLAREFVNKIQNMRKAAGLEVTQRITIRYCSDVAVREAVEKYRDYVDAETLSTKTEHTASLPADRIGWQEWEINGHTTHIGITA